MKMASSDQLPASSRKSVLSTQYLVLSTRLLALCVLCAFAVVLSPAAAQEPADTSGVSDDAVNAVAENLYCPVCENIPLDVCPTQACIQWREEIRIQLAEGQSEQQIISNFVNRYGDRVVGVPEDPLLRGISLITPWLIGAIVLVSGVSILLRWRRGPGVSLTASAGATAPPDDDSSYRARLEADVVRRR